MYRAVGSSIFSVSERVTGIAICIVVVGALMAPCLAQKPSPSGGNPTTPRPNSSPTPKINLPSDTGPTSSLLLSGRVVLDQGEQLPESVIVEEICGTTVRARARTNLKGNFSMSLGQAANTELMDNPDASENGRNSENRQMRISGCDLRAVLPGFVSSQVPLSGTSEIGMKDVGTIVLKRIGGPARSSGPVSATSFQVPDDARKEFEKAQKAFEKEKPTQAQKHLLKAVEIYPKYASAWVALGQLHVQANSVSEAKQAFSRAMEADANYVPPYLYLGLLAAREKNWEQALKWTEQAVKLNPTDYADAYFIKAIACFNLRHVPEAQKAALKAAEIDRQHRQPRIQYLLAAIEEANGNRDQAAIHLREYLQIAPNAPDAAAAKARLAELSKQQSATAER